VVERAVTLADDAGIDVQVLPPAMRDPGAPQGGPTAVLPEGGVDLQAQLDALERQMLEAALERAGGVKTEAARLLSVTFRSLRYRLAKYGIGGGN
jgi:two-component system response regulator PilR (NtrC family)